MLVSFIKTTFLLIIAVVGLTLLVSLIYAVLDTTRKKIDKDE